MARPMKQECEHCGRSFTIGAGLTRHKRACQHKDHERAGTVVDLMARLQESLRPRTARRAPSDGGRE